MHRALPPSVVACALVAGCLAHERPGGHVDYCEREIVGGTVTLADTPHGVDLVFVVDGSAAMNGLDDAVRNLVHDAIARMATGDINGDGRLEVQPERSIRVAIISTDMGVGGAASDPSCPSGDGDDARLHTGAVPPSATCPAVPASAGPDGILEYVADGPVDGDDFADQVTCALRVGTGCRYARGMDALVLALDPARPPILRPDAQAIIVVVTGQDDCSTTSPAQVFASASPAALRCHDAADHLRDLDEVASTLIARIPSPDRTTLVLVAGVGVATSPEEALRDPTMEERVDPTSGDRLTPVCMWHEASATPARRWVGLAERLGNAGLAIDRLRSICVPNAPLDAWIGEPANIVLDGICLESVVEGVDFDAMMRAHCAVTVTLPPIGTGALVEHCSELLHPEAFTLARTELVESADGTEQMSEVCSMRQMPPSGGAGWAIVGTPVCHYALTFLPIGLREGRVDYQCDARPQPTTTAIVRRGHGCERPSEEHTAEPYRCHNGHAVDGDETTPPLACDAYTAGCQIPCTSDADCDAIAETLRCDLRSPEVYFGARPPEGLPPVRGFCMDARCDPSDRD